MEKKTSKNILLAIMGVLILTELIMKILTVSEGLLFKNIISAIPLILIALYGFLFYKKPHGNMLKYAMLTLAASQILVQLLVIKNYGVFYSQAAVIFSLCILVYVAGRLNRIENNKNLLALSLAIQLVCTFCDAISVSAQFTFAYIFSWFNIPISTLTLTIVYLVRYKEHKEAGLADVPKAK